MHIHSERHLSPINFRSFPLKLQKTSSNFIQLPFRGGKAGPQERAVDDLREGIETSENFVEVDRGPGLAVSRNSDGPVEVRLVDISLEGDVFGVS
jgi:hypothetical protein